MSKEQLTIIENKKRRSDLYQGIGFRIAEYGQLQRLVSRLRDYGNNGPIYMSCLSGTKDGDAITAMLQRLMRYGIVLYKQVDGSQSYSIFVTNRYYLELLGSGQRSLFVSKKRQGDLPPNIVYYHAQSGVVFCNGVRKRLKERNKLLFTALYVASPGNVSRSNLETIAKSYGHADDAPEYVVGGAFRNLRGVCDVDAQVIKLDNDGGKLNALCYPLSLQFPSSVFLTD